MDDFGEQFSSPFLGTFFQSGGIAFDYNGNKVGFSSPFLGTFFQ